MRWWEGLGRASLQTGNEDGCPVVLRGQTTHASISLEKTNTSLRPLFLPPITHLADCKRGPQSRIMKTTMVGYVSLCPRLFVPTSLYAPKSGILCPRLFVPTSLYAQKSGILCPRLFVPTSLYVPPKVVFCAHVSLCPRLFVPTSLYAQTYACGSFG